MCRCHQHPLTFPFVITWLLVVLLVLLQHHLL
jgi:hypothetical protein